ncbi:hypothetical protein PIB30_014582 [Stylosanthes scabra]|uniref:Uncharacterized protein n=1 Tax=Stylosanthes scabra TaxID=79078 RepID=A0ABU6Q6L2_9FABA|nr:hypothetical protein [Stylosanthes scabra]
MSTKMEIDGGASSDSKRSGGLLGQSNRRQGHKAASLGRWVKGGIELHPRAVVGYMPFSTDPKPSATQIGCSSDAHSLR